MASNRFVSRGGDKLQAALDQFKIDVNSKVVLDVGSSTGGFVDCLLQNGAKKVYALDTAYGELAWKLRNDPRVVVMERTNVLHLESLPELVDLITIDAGWTKLELVLPVVKKFLKSGGIIIALLKPHYEADRRLLKKGVLPEDIAEKVKNEVLFEIENLQFDKNQIGRIRFKIENCIDSPILGGGGNKEYLLLLFLEES